MSMNAKITFITVTRMLCVEILLAHLTARVFKDILEMELTVRVRAA